MGINGKRAALWSWGQLQKIKVRVGGYRADAHQTIFHRQIEFD